MTTAEMHERMLDWVEGRLSHNNVMLDVEASVDHRPQTIASIAQADAAEVQKWAAAWSAAAQVEAAEAIRADVALAASRLR